MHDHPTTSLVSSVSPRLSQVNLEYLESKLESVDGEEVQRIQDNINSLFHHCVQALGEEHQIKVVNALQVGKDMEETLNFSPIAHFSQTSLSVVLIRL